MEIKSQLISTDEVALQTLLLLRSSGHFTIHLIAKTLNQPMDAVWKRITWLEKNKLLDWENEGYKISKEGSNILLELGYHVPKPPEDKKGKKPSERSSIDPFGSFTEAIYWIIFPLLMISLIAGVLLAGYSKVISYWWAATGLLPFFLLIVYCVNSFQKVPEYENVVVFRLGKCIGKRGPGPVLLIPILDKSHSVDLRVKHQAVPHETCITQDNVQLDVDFVFYWKIQEPVWSITKVTDPEESIRLLATALLRAVIAHFKFNDVLNQRESINDLLKQKIDEISADWGVYVTTMEIREIKPPEEIVKSMHKQVSAEWQKKATVIQAEGDALALRMLDDAAMNMDENTKSLKYYETLNKLGDGSATKYILPLELTNLARGLTEKRDNDGAVPDPTRRGLPDKP